MMDSLITTVQNSMMNDWQYWLVGILSLGFCAFVCRYFWLGIEYGYQDESGYHQGEPPEREGVE